MSSLETKEDKTIVLIHPLTLLILALLHITIKLPPHSQGFKV